MYNTLIGFSGIRRLHKIQNGKDEALWSQKKWIAAYVKRACSCARD